MKYTFFFTTHHYYPEHRDTTTIMCVPSEIFLIFIDYIFRRRSSYSSTLCLPHAKKISTASVHSVQDVTPITAIHRVYNCDNSVYSCFDVDHSWP